ncbi:unnamed protein product [Cylicocyclus nassatus]|uniref:C2H2-type domain-containing protein n=1 Tax=Cylicocyclus nassatus TaxID=53992 RepID=A0AA36H8P2_CYLNA|nr:unnamed protein product [Cylicocyclus nassatus]
MLPRRTSVLRVSSGIREPNVHSRNQHPRLTPVRVNYVTDKFSTATRQPVSSQMRYIARRVATSTTSAFIGSPQTEDNNSLVQFDNDDVPNTRTLTARSVKIPVVRSSAGGRYLLRIPKSDTDGSIEHRSNNNQHQYSFPYEKRLVIPTVPPSMSMGGEYAEDQYELVYETNNASPPVRLVERDDYDNGRIYNDGKKRYFCSEMTCFWHGPTNASLRRHMMVTHSRSALNNPSVRTPNDQSNRRQTKPKGVKCSECGQMAYSRPLLLRHMTQAHGIVAPLIYKTFSDRESLQKWLEQLRDTHAVEFVVSSGSKKWGQGLQVHYLTCSRSGEQKERPNKKHRRPTRPSIKCGKNCMAYLKMKQNPTVSELKIEACLHHSGHEIDASKIRLEQNEWCRVIQLIREIDEGLLQVDIRHIMRIREILGNNGRFRLMTDEGLCEQLPKWIAQYMEQEEMEKSALYLEPEEGEKEDPFISGYEPSVSPLLDDFSNYELETSFVTSNQRTNYL